MQPFTIASTMAGFNKVLESMEIEPDYREDEQYLTSEILQADEAEPENLGLKEVYMSCKKVTYPKVPEMSVSKL